MRFRYTILFILLCSCSRGNRELIQKLQNVDELMAEHPDRALTTIKLIDTLALRTKALKARYSLLLTMALDKNNIYNTNLDLIRPASEYFALHGSYSDRMKTYFYKGRIYYNLGDYERAMHYYFTALEDSSKVADNHIKESVNSAISDIFSKNESPLQELNYRLDALKYGYLSKDNERIWTVTGHLASCYGNLMMWDEAERAYKDFFSMPAYDSLTFFRTKINYAKNILLRTNPDPKSCVNILDNIEKIRPDAMTTEAYAIYAYAHQLLGNKMISDGIISKLESMEGGQSDIVKLWRYRVYREQGIYDKALNDLEQVFTLQESLKMSRARQFLIYSQCDVLKAETIALKKEKEIVTHRFLIIVLIFFILWSIAVILYFHLRSVLKLRVEELSALREKSKQKLDLLDRRMNEINTRLEQKEELLFALRKRYACMYKARYKTINDLCAAYLSPIRKERKDVIYDEVMQQIGSIVEEKESKFNFMTSLNDSLDNIIDKLRKDLPGHKEQDFYFLTYVIAGFDAKTISGITGYSVATVYTKKNRLKEEISRLSSINRDFYLEYID